MSVEDANRVLVRPVLATVVSTAAVVLVRRRSCKRPCCRRRPPQGDRKIAEAGILGRDVLPNPRDERCCCCSCLFASFFMLWGNLGVMWRVGRGNAEAGRREPHPRRVRPDAAWGCSPRRCSTTRSRTATGPTCRAVGRTSSCRWGRTVAADGYRWTYAGQEVDADGRPVYVMDVVDRRGNEFHHAERGLQGRPRPVDPTPRRPRGRDEATCTSPSSPRAMSESDAATAETTLARGDSVRLATAGARPRLHRHVRRLRARRRPRRGRRRTADSVDLAVAARLVGREPRDGRGRACSGRSTSSRRGASRCSSRTGRRTGAWAWRSRGWRWTRARSGSRSRAPTVAQEEWVVVQAYEKPFISLLWLGTGILGVGFVVSFRRRLGESRR